MRPFVNVVSMEEFRMARSVLMANTGQGCWRRVRGRQRICYMNGVKLDGPGSRWMTVEAARQCSKDREEWRIRVQM